MSIKMYFDGASKGNPGPIGYGFVIYKDDEELLHGFGPDETLIGTNNEAEYKGLIEGLTKCMNIDNLTDLQVYGDSKLIIEQMNLKWKINAENLKPLFQKAKSLEKKLNEKLNKSVKYGHVKRELNKRADTLANIRV